MERETGEPVKKSDAGGAAGARMPAVFFDRDGTLMEEVHFCSDPARVAVIPGAPGKLRQLNEAGFALVIVTNQSGMARGYFGRGEFERVQAELLRQLAPARVLATYVDDSHPDAPSARRKPSPRMVFEAAEEHGLDLSRSYFVGDRTADVLCGRRAGVRTVLVETGYGREHRDCEPDLIAPDVCAAVDAILKEAACRV